ncbi:SusC/RagA family TonB-linked outer membrane protein [Sphingobacterium alkalisoli]|uniref:SusC/RagA family TonB-linked outer membrane protein n=1 Tax=Sphingobacterium alkalisoli TaxID=1874115 RepID=A0A4U0H8R1_9SPHI|nr:SusC/RagA family TonB-linked outer membrane protein [Sphingobacterium alkalisoli]TJY68146.1 SusC/RagA family TonB-linked outer membrane protein [Sphingobacterium alkalisoli]GGH08739.1 SusC/RagA family TonB-linked outer membrane protein [Sphingobacterium alkalisoli]
MKQKLLLVFIGLFMITTCLMAQQKAVSGRVSSATGEGLGNVTVTVQGTTRSTQTTADGSFSIQAAPGEVLVFRAIGSEEKKQTVGDGSVYNISLMSTEEALDEVVVTAFGIKQQTKSLGFAVQGVSAKELTESNQPNVVNALQGKVAGVQVTNSGGAPGASANIMIRGGSSLSENNQPLFVVDGIPVDNTTPVAQGGLSAGAAPASNRGVDINPEDIESMTVLKGPAAAALYGIRAAGGAIVITTKKGVSGQGRVTYGNTFSVDNVNKLPELQNQYVQGVNGVFDPESYLSWGPAAESGDYQIYDNIDGYFKTAFSQNHDFSASGGSDKTKYYASASVLDQNGIVDHFDFGRKSFRLNAEHKVFDNLKFGANMNYVNSDRTYFAQGSKNGIMGVFFWPRNVDMTDYINPDDGTQNMLSSGSDGAMDNPYWTINKNAKTNDVNRFLAVGDVSYDPFSWLNLTYRLGTDYYTETFQSVTTPTSQASESGYLVRSGTNNQITTSTFLATAKKDFDDFGFTFTAGHNLEMMDRKTTTVSATNFIEPDFVSINNSNMEDRTSVVRSSRRRIVGVFGDLNMNWKNMVFLNFRGRNDWSSTLPVSDNSFFYPSISTSFILTDLYKEISGSSSTGILDYAKLRGAWAQVGKDAPPHKLATLLGTSINNFTINPRGFISSIADYYGNPTLKPEFTNSYELGLDLRFFQGRLGLDFAAYKSKTEDQILGTRVPPSAGAFLAYLNGGSIENKGIEAVLNTQPIRKDDFRWSFDVNFTANRSKVLDLPGSLDRVELSDAWVVDDAAQGAAFLNGTLFGINGRTWKTNGEGQYLLTNAGLPQVVTTLSQIGDRNPNWLAGVTNTFDYKGFGLSFMWDFRQGGDVFNSTAFAMVKAGTSPLTLDRGTTVIPGVIESTGQVNTTAANLDQNYYETLFASQGANFVEDGSWVRLRYVSLTYNAKSFARQLKLNNLQFTFTGRNLLLFTDYSGVDPEVSGSGAGVGGSGSFGFDNLGLPATRGFDLGLRFSF